MAVAGLSIRLLLDHHVDARLAQDLRREGFDVTAPRDLGTQRATDEEHLRWAAEHGRFVFTFDIGDFRPLADAWGKQGRAHAGLLLLAAPQRLPYGRLLRRLLAFLDAVSAEEMRNQVRWLDASWSPDP